MTDAYELSPAHKLASDLRVPLFKADTGRQEKIGQLEDYMLLSAYYLGEVQAERLAAHQALAVALEEWAEVTTWETGGRKTDKGVEDAKRQMAPETWTTITRTRWRVERLSEEIERLDRDATKVSRAYTLITGG